MGAGDQDLVYRIRTESDLKAFEAAKNALKEQKKAYEELGKSTAEVDRQLKRVEATLESQAGKSLKVAEGWNKAIEKIRAAGGNVDAMVAERNAVLQQGGLKTPGRFAEAFSAYRGAGGGLEGIKEAAGVFGKGPLAIAAAGVAGVEAGKKALEEYAIAEERVAKLDAAMEQHGLLSDENRAKFQELAASMERLTTIGKGDWVSVIQRLIQFGANSANMDKAVDGVKNLAGIMDGDLQSAALAVGKALSGNFEAFSRLGIQIDEHMTQAQKLDRLWQELASRGGGQLEAQTDTLTGSFRRLKTGVGDLLETVGGHLAKYLYLKDALYGLGTTLSYLAEKLSLPIAKSDQLKKTVGDLAGGLHSAEAANQMFAESMDKSKKSIDSAAKSLADYLAKLTEKANLDKAEIDSKFNRDTAFIDKQLKEGKITPVQAALAKSQLEEDKEKTKSVIDKDVRERAISGLDAQIAQSQSEYQAKQKEAEKAAAKLRILKVEQKNSPDLDLAERISAAEREAEEKKKEAAETGKTVGEANEDRIRQKRALEDAQRSADRIFEYDSAARRAKSGISVQDAGGGSLPGVTGISDQEFIKHIPRTQGDAERLESNLKSALGFYDAVAKTVGRAANATEAQRKAMENALARMKDLDHKLELLESQIARMPSR
jgi:hypothetical protein